MINVTKPFLAPRDEYNKYLEKIWSSNILTNMGPLSCEFENNLKKYLDVNNISFVSNGTIAIQLAIKALNIKGEIITTPFSYVATTSSIVWENCKPKFVDIDRETLNIDHNLIENNISRKTKAILVTHVFGNPCNIDTINKISKKHNLKVIYDGAHAFGVKYKDSSVFNFGDISTCSLHATKLLNSGEGGIVVTNNFKIHEKIEYMKNFGHDGPEKFHGLGINAKNSEFHAALGLVNFKYLEKIIKKRKLLTEVYDNLLNLKKPKWNLNSSKNYSYYPVIFKSENELIKIKNKLENNNIFGRRYFYPSLNKSLNYVDFSIMENSEDISKRVFCLPLYYDLEINVVERICSIINEAIIK